MTTASPEAIISKQGDEAVGPRKATVRGLFGTSVLMVVVLTVILGLIYPLVTMGVAQVLFNHQANGSLITRDGKIVGSSLIGQNFTKPKYFWGRLSDTAPTPYNAAASAGSNLGPTNKILLQNTIAQANLIRKVNHLPPNYVLPSDAVSSSASGIDPDISPAYADLQAPRVAQVRNLPLATVMGLVHKYTSGRTFGLLGEPRVNFTELNLALDDLQK
jgi:K+-transporting ATPase ATPase C chain